MLRSKVCPTNPNLTRGRVHAELPQRPPDLLLIGTFATGYGRAAGIARCWGTMNGARR